MAHLLKFYYDNGTYLDLTAPPWYVLDYQPSTPDLSSVIEANEMEDGEELLRTTRRNVKETITVMLKPTQGNNMSQVQTQVELLERILSEAIEYQENGGKGSKTYLLYQPEDTSAIYRSEIMSGDVSVDSGGNSRNWAISDAFYAVITIYRRFYWEGAETALTLQNSGGSGSSVTVYNRDEAAAGMDNYALITTSPIEGVIASPLILKALNSTVALYAKKFFLGLSAYADTSAVNLYDSSTGTGTGGTDNDAIWNNGVAFTKTMPTGEGQIMYWNVSGAELAKYGGRFYRVFVRTGKSIQNDHYLRFRVSYPQGGFTSVLDDTGEIHVDSTKELQDLGVVQLPPNLVGETSLAGVSFEVRGYSDNAAQTFYLDYLLLIPADSFVVCSEKGGGIANNQKLILDGVLDKIYAADTNDANKVPQFVQEGQGLFLRPNKSHKLLVMVEDNQGKVLITRTTSISATYRPRRLTI